MSAILAGLLVASADLVFPGGAALRVEARTAGAWHHFLDKLFRHFDRDGDGTLSPAEAGRVFPLPLPGGRTATPDFAHLDADRDGGATPAEFVASYERAGFAPAVIVPVTPTPADLHLSAALLRHLDRDGDGRLSPAELAAAPRLLRRLDEDEDEALSPAELLVGVAPPTPAPAPAAWPTAGPARGPVAVWRVSFVAGKPSAPPAVPGVACVAEVRADDPAAGAREAREFLLAQFRGAVGERPALPMADADADPSLRGLAGVFPAADRDGDARLTEAELTALLDLIELGVGCQLVVTAADRGRNPFDRLDANGDGRLDLWELRRAADRLPGGEVPRGLRLTASRGPIASTFAGVPVALPKKPAAKPARAADGPAWFRAADRNGDGFVSPAEFVGPPEAFRRLDADGDGRVSVAEATGGPP